MKNCGTFQSDELMKKENPEAYAEIVKKRKEILDKIRKEK